MAKDKAFLEYEEEMAREMKKLEKARAMECFGGMVEIVELEPDPNTQDKLTEEYNCKNCGSHKYCRKLANTLK